MQASHTAVAEREDRLGEMLARLIEVVETGKTIDRADWLARHPEFVVELNDYFASEERLRSVAGPLRKALAADSAVAASTLHGGLPLPARAGEGFGDYEVLEEIGRGGMGIVFKARQKGANRLVALKLLRSDPLDGPEQAQRFRNEAEMVAQLDHPNVVPLYEVGEQAGQVYFSMKFLPGGSLAEQLPLFTAQPRRAAQVVAAVARGVHHAHQHGVLHRDLKPGNVLLDAEGRPCVADFGLGKRVQADGSLTQSGAIVGTPAYMAPEQASGARGAVTTASDVYGLGAILYALLRGRPPFQAETVLDLLMQVRESDPEPPGGSNRLVDRDLETICLKCLQKDPATRYGSALALAKDLERWLRGEPILAKPVSAVERVWRWCRRHPVAPTAALGVLVAVAVLTGSIGWVAGEHRARQRVAEVRVREALEESAPGLREGNPYDAALVAAVQRGLAQLDTGAVGPELRGHVEQLVRDQEMLVRLETARLHSAAGSKETAGFEIAGSDEDYALAFKEYGLHLTILDSQEAAERIRNSAIHTHLVSALYAWFLVKEGLHREAGASMLAELLERADDDPWRQRVRRAVKRKDRFALEKLAGEGVSSQPLANRVSLAGVLRVMGNMETAERLLWPAQAANPGDFWTNVQLADILLSKKSPDLPQAIRFFQAALGIRPRSPAVYNNLGNALLSQGKLAEAEAAYRKSIELRPENALAHANLGWSLAQQKKPAEAVAAYRRAIELQPDFALAHTNLGIALRAQGKLAEAVAAHRKAIELQPNLAAAHTNLGNALRAQGKLAEALAAHRKAIELQSDFFEAHCNLGIVLDELSKFADAEAVYRKAVALKPDHAEALTDLGNALHKQGKLPEAEAEYRKAIALEPGLARAHFNLANTLRDQKKTSAAVTAYRKAIEVQSDFASAYYNLGVTLEEQRKPAEAEAAYRKAVEFRPDHAEAHCNLANILSNQGKPAEAEAAYRKAIALKPDLFEAHCNLGTLLQNQGKLAEAVVAHRKAIALQPRLAGVHTNLGNALRALGKLAEAEAAYRKAIEVQPDFAAAYSGLGLALKDQKKLVEAVAAGRKAIEVQPNYVEAYFNLGITLQEQGRFADALAMIKRGHELASKREDWPHPSAQWVRQARQLVVLDEKLPKVLRGEAQLASAAEMLALANMCQSYKKRYVAAARFYAAAFAAQPKLADELSAQHRYNAACAAVLAGSGKDEDASGLGEMQRLHWRRQALTWLQTDLRAWQQLLATDPVRARPTIATQMQHWLDDPDFIVVRGTEALGRLPSEERAAWTKLWIGAAELLGQTSRK